MNPEIIATYRLQLRNGFGFQEATDILPYLALLGISHLYMSPYLQALKGSTHGYDIVDPSRIDSSLGDEASFQLFLNTVRSFGLNLMIDIVPNHMAIEANQNPWWWDVLKKGPKSQFAKFFDLDWDSSDERWSNKILLSLLEDHYGRVLEQGKFHLIMKEGRPILCYGDHFFPINDESISQIEIDRLNHDIDALDSLIQKQYYRLASWRTANNDLGYRRFFDIKELVGLRVEDPDVFDSIHALPIKWVSGGSVQALRVDHPDGLRDPKAYFHTLEKACPHTWIIAEKILMNETLRKDWHIAGTTGYDFLNRLNQLFVHPEGKAPLSRIYKNFIGKESIFSEIVTESKLLVLSQLFGSEVNQLTHLLTLICERHRRYRDYTWEDLHDALVAVAAGFPVYRSYVSEEGASKEDEEIIEKAITTAIKQKPEADPLLFQFLKDILLLRVDGNFEKELAFRFQQLTSPVMAKGYEDTALYRFHRLVALNEVGGSPDHFGLSIAEFHDQCKKCLPLSLLASSTHDTKRSEDVRARLALLSEIPDQFDAALKRWKSQNAHYQSSSHDANAEYLFYQTLIGAWPIDTDRVLAYMEKACREAKEHTSWTQKNKEYENSMRSFFSNALNHHEFRQDCETFTASLIHPGRINSLSQTVIKLTCPGIPDIYQGNEVWNTSFVDPDNRRQINFSDYQTLLQDIKECSPKQVCERMDEGAPKLWLIHKILQIRKQHPEIFLGEYTPIHVSNHVICFMRSQRLMTVAPRFVMNKGWKKTFIELPEGVWTNVLTGKKSSPSVEELFSEFPVALLMKEV